MRIRREIAFDADERQLFAKLVGIRGLLKDANAAVQLTRATNQHEWFSPKHVVILADILDRLTSICEDQTDPDYWRDVEDPSPQGDYVERMVEVRQQQVATLHECRRILAEAEVMV